VKRFIGQCNWLIFRYRHSINKPNLNYTSQTKHTTDQYNHTKSKSFTMTILKFLILMFTYTPWARIYPSVLFAIIWRLHLLTVKRPLSAKTNKKKHTVKPLITNTSEELIKCRLDNFSMSFILYYVNFSICENK